MGPAVVVLHGRLKPVVSFLLPLVDAPEPPEPLVHIDLDEHTFLRAVDSVEDTVVLLAARALPLQALTLQARPHFPLQYSRQSHIRAPPFYL